MIPSQPVNRRDLFHSAFSGLGATALLALLGRDARLGAEPLPATANLHPPKAKRAIHICLVGGMSHLDSFDYKPALEENHGKTLQYDKKPDIFFGKIGLLRKPDFQFKPRGQSGLMISDLFPHIGQMADELTILKSMESNSANHTPALFLENSGFEANGFPSLGSWLSYGLGSETEALPVYVVLSDQRGGPNGGATNWSNAFLPGHSQGVELRGGNQPMRDLFPARELAAGADRATWEFVNSINQDHAASVGEDRVLAARIRSYQLAAQMQLSVPEVSDLTAETQATHDMYGVDDENTADMGRRCLLARRLVERGVRFVQLYSGGPIGGSPRSSWDAHESVKRNHAREAKRIDKPVAALLQDLKQRGLLEDTLVLFTTEFGRTPFAESDAAVIGEGRDHNRYGFSVWMAGAGLKPGMAFGSTDELGWKTVEHPVPWHDFHATVLHLFGINHERLTFYHNGIERRLTNVHGEVVRGILA